MLLLFVLGTMNMLWIAALTALVLVEKVAPRGEWVAPIAGASMVAGGAWTLAAGQLPSFQAQLCSGLAPEVDDEVTVLHLERRIVVDEETAAAALGVVEREGQPVGSVARRSIRVGQVSLHRHDRRRIGKGSGRSRQPAAHNGNHNRES
jgi:hypothetical protein